MIRGFELVKTDPAKALAEFRQVNPAQHSSAWYGIGLAHEGLGHLDQAAAALASARAAAPDQIGPRTALARLHLLQGELTTAQRELDALLQEAPGDLLTVLLFSVSAQDESRRGRALSALRRWPEKRPQQEMPEALSAEYLLTRGTLEQAAGDEKQAKTTLEQARSARLSAPRGALALAKLSQALRQNRLAAALLGKLADTQREPAFLHEIADVAFELNDLALVKRAIDQFPVFPEQPRALLLTGRYQLASHDPRAAIRSLERGLARLPKDDLLNRERGEYQLAKALLAVGKTKDAQKVLRRAIKRSPRRLALQLTMSEAELTLGQTAEAVARLKRLQGDHPKSAKVAERLGLAQLAARDYPGAEASFRTLTSLVPKSTRAPRLVARALAGQGKRDEVTRELERAADRKPFNVSSLRVLVGHHLEQKEPERAVQTILKREQAAPDRAAIRLLLAATYEKLGRKVLLRKTLEELTQTDPKNATGWTALARLEQLEKHPDAARAALERVVQLEPKSPLAHARLAVHFAKSKKSAEAAREYEVVLKLAGNDFVALNNAAALYADELEQPDRAVDLAEKALHLAPNHPAVLDTLGWALLRRGRKQDSSRALELLQRASSASGSVESRRHYAAALERVGRSEEAKQLRSKLKAER